MPVAVSRSITPDTFQTIEDRIRQIREFAQEDYPDQARKALLVVVDDYRELIPADLRAAASAKSGDYLGEIRKVNAGYGNPTELAKIKFEMLNIGESILEVIREIPRAAPVEAAAASPVSDTGVAPVQSFGSVSPGSVAPQPDNVVVLPPPTVTRKSSAPEPPDVPPPARRGNDGPVVVHANQISKRFSSTQFALAEMSFDLKLGQITALVGRNGAGKSTLLRMVLGELGTDTGSITYPLLENSGRRRIREHIGYVAQRSAQWRGRVRENLEFFAAAYGIRGKANVERVTWLLNRFGLIEYEDHSWAQLSGGYQLRFDLARAMLHRPSILILDEPLANLDVVSQQDFLDDLKIIANSRGSEATILVTSQHLFEMEAIADQLILLREGQTAFLEEVTRLGDGRQSNSFEVKTDATEQYLLKALSDLKIRAVRRFTTHYQLDFPADVESSEILRALAGLPVPITYVRDISRSTRPLMTAAEHT